MAEENIKNKSEQKRPETVAQASKGDGKPLFEWTAPDSAVQKRGNGFYSVIILVGLALMTILALQGIWTGAVLVAIATFMYTTLTQSKPKNIESAIFPQGIVVDERVSNFSELKSFWVSVAEVPKIKFQQNGRFSGQVTMPVLEKDINNVREILLAHLPEETDKGEELSDMINRWIRF